MTAHASGKAEKAAQWVWLKSNWQENIYGDKSGMSFEQQALRPSSITENLALAYLAGYSQAEADFAGAIEALEKIAKNKWDCGDGVTMTGSHHSLMQIAREALAKINQPSQQKEK